jgi:predicted N-acetyltransferase YhbS
LPNRILLIAKLVATNELVRVIRQGPDGSNSAACRGSPANCYHADQKPPRVAAMKLSFATATESDAAELAALHAAVAAGLAHRFGADFGSSSPSERAILAKMRKPKFSRTLIARSNRHIVATLRLHTMKPWAIDTTYFTVARRPLYLTGMAVHPNLKRKGVGRLLLKEAEAIARSWPADAIRLDAYDSAAGAGPFYAKCGFRKVAHVTYKKNPLIYFELILAHTNP